MIQNIQLRSKQPKKTTKFHYDFSELNSYDCLVKAVISIRGLGKTYGKVNELLNKAIQKDCTVIYLVENEPMLKELMQNNGIKFISQFYNNFEQERLKMKGNMLYYDDIMRMELFDLAHFGMAKRTKNNNVRYIIFDECIELSSRANRFDIEEAIDSIVQSYCRLNKIELWLLGNTENPNSPFVTKLKIDEPDNFGKIYSWKMSDKDRIVVHYVDAANEYPEYYAQYMKSSSASISQWLGKGSTVSNQFGFVDSKFLYKGVQPPDYYFNFQGQYYGVKRWASTFYICSATATQFAFALTNKDKGIQGPKGKLMLLRLQNAFATNSDSIKFSNTMVYHRLKEVLKL